MSPATVVSGTIDRLDAEQGMLVLQRGEILRLPARSFDWLAPGLEVLAVCEAEADGTWRVTAISLEPRAPAGEATPPGCRRVAVIGWENRGAYETLKRHVSPHDMVQVIWDRRRGDRRRTARAVGADRRRSDRRASPPETWKTAGFLLIPPA
jgi:hypothetical protein